MASVGVNLLSKPLRSQNLITFKSQEEFKPIVTKEESTAETLSFTNQNNQIDPSYYPTLQ